MNLPYQGVVCDDNLALKIGELLCEALYNDVGRQQPLSIADKGAYWRVEGSRNRNGEIDGPSDFFLSIEKADARVTDIGKWWRYHPNPSVVPIINEHLARIKLEQSAMIDPTDALNEPDSPASGDGMLLLIKLARGGVVFSGELATEIGKLLCETHYGDFSRQAPLAAVDKEVYWRVEGSWNRDGKGEGPGPFFMSIAKYDGRVTEMGE